MAIPNFKHYILYDFKEAYIKKFYANKFIVFHNSIMSNFHDASITFFRSLENFYFRTYCTSFFTLHNTSVAIVTLKIHIYIMIAEAKRKREKNITKLSFFNSTSYYAWGTLVIMQIFDFRFLADLHVLGSRESKKHKISMLSGCLFVSKYDSVLVC